MILREPLTPISSEKMIYHISLDIQRLGLSFRVGDSIGVYGQNNPNLVDAWIKALGATSQEIVTHPKTQEQLPLREFLTFRANLSRLTSSFLQRILTVAPAGPSKEKLALLFDEHQKETLGLFLKEYEPLDILKQFPPETFPCDLVCQGLSPLLPRFYSIASSPTYSPDRLDLTVSHLRYFHRGEERFGVASHFLCFLANPQETTIPVYVQPAAHFTLPKESSTPIIMIGPGTGVAPYRGFMQERLQQGSTGKHWLFFGEKHQKTHFFYSQFWQDLEKQSILRLTTAFSRDQSEKVYVQHKMLEHAQDLWDWVQEGASIFICGDAEKMAKQVEESWLTIFMQQGNLSLEEAKALLLALRKQRRYLADVY
ncbi:MAG: hypothetical protein KGZ30_04055 [Anaplasmataceae bacterium]|nr:hypothetical protein [Anaplasmataceae bacterium]